NIQQLVLLPCGFQFFSNVGSARSVGFEIETTFRPFDGMFLAASTGFTDAELTETVEGTPFIDGDPLQQVPRWTASGTVDYEAPVTIGDFFGFGRADVSYVGESISRTVDAGNPRIRPSYTIVDMRGGLRSDKYEVAFFIDNVTDERAVFGDNRTLAAEALGRQRVITNRPRTIGIDLRANF
ncbi:MAG: TonB-dependent receptor, partial [Pseudomonadota bacterium]